MSTAIVLPTLSAWAEGHITALYKAKTDAEYAEAFEAFFAKDTSITINGVHVSREDAKKKRLASHGPGAFQASPPSASFSNVVQVDKEKGNEFKAGSVGLFFTVTSFEPVHVHDVPAETKVTSSLNLTIGPDPTLHHPANVGGIRGYFDPRRVSQLSEVFQVVPIKNIEH